MITPRLFYRLCLAQGGCLAVGFGIPASIQAFLLASKGMSFQVLFTAWFTFLGTWGLLTAMTGLLLSRELARAAAASSGAKSVEEPVLKGDSDSIPAPTQGPSLSLYRVDDFDDSTLHGATQEWKATWKRPSPDQFSPREASFNSP